MADNFRFGQGPAPEVISYIEGKALKPSFDWRDIYGEEHAYAFTVAKATQIDALSQIHEATIKAIKEGTPLKQFQATLGAELKKIGWWGKSHEVDPVTDELRVVQLGSERRLKTIYWANTRSAYAAGKWTRIQRTKEHLPYLLYQLGPAREHRPHHESKENIILPIDDEFWHVWYPPNGWGCVCWVRQITRDEADELGGLSEKPDIPNRTWKNQRTGKTEEIPVGIDAGWNSNAGRARHRTLAKHLGGTLDTAPDHIRKAAMVDLVASQLFRQVQSGALASKKAFAPVAVISQEVKEALGTQTRVAFLSSDDATKQLIKRAQLSAKDYVIVQQLLDTGTIRRESDKDIVVNGQVDGQFWHAVFRVTKSGDEIFLKSFRRTNPRQIEKYNKRGEKL